MEMGNAFGKAVVPGLEDARRAEAMRLAVAHKDADSLLYSWDGCFEEEDEEFPYRQAEENEQENTEGPIDREKARILGVFGGGKKWEGRVVNVSAFLDSHLGSAEIHAHPSGLVISLNGWQIFGIFIVADLRTNTTPKGTTTADEGRETRVEPSIDLALTRSPYTRVKRAEMYSCHLNNGNNAAAPPPPTTTTTKMLIQILCFRSVAAIALNLLIHLLSTNLPPARGFMSIQFCLTNCLGCIEQEHRVSTEPRSKFQICVSSARQGPRMLRLLLISQSSVRYHAMMQQLPSSSPSGIPFRIESVRLGASESRAVCLTERALQICGSGTSVTPDLYREKNNFLGRDAGSSPAESMGRRISRFLGTLI
ncbi:hypothetical protein DFH06DRAFT_1128146 [Mycena polygramma]|nr:hypothetical protein DFH06DRAFT_1128146 [Mycena polygramma]